MISQRKVNCALRKHDGESGVVVVPGFSAGRGYVPRDGWYAVLVKANGKAAGTMSLTATKPTWVPLRPGHHVLEFFTDRGSLVHRLPVDVEPCTILTVSFRAPRRRWNGRLRAATWSVSA